MKRRHHYLTASYLVGFSDGESRTSKIYAFDKKDNRLYQTSPENSAVIKDYYTVDSPSLDPNAVEDAFAQVESTAIPILRRTADSLELPIGDDWNIFLYFISLFGARVPRVRNTFADNIAKLGRTIGKVYFANSPNEKIASGLRKAGVEIDKIPDIDSLKDFALGDQYTIDVDQTYQISMILFMAQIIYISLLERDWYLVYRTDNMTNSFVTSDCPLLLKWKDPTLSAWPPGFGLTETRVLFPLTRTAVLVGEYEDVSVNKLRARNNTVRLFNTIQTVSCHRFVYSYECDYGLLNKDRGRTTITGLINSK